VVKICLPKKTAEHIPNHCTLKWSGDLLAWSSSCLTWIANMCNLQSSKATTIFYPCRAGFPMVERWFQMQVIAISSFYQREWIQWTQYWTQQSAGLSIFSWWYPSHTIKFYGFQAFSTAEPLTKWSCKGLTAKFTSTLMLAILTHSKDLCSLLQ
jgi:hypothetical protein